VKRKSLLALVGAIAVAVLAVIGVAVVLTGGDEGAGGGGTATAAASSPAARAIPPAQRFKTSAQIAVALQAHGVADCSFDRIRTECRYHDGRYVAATVITEDYNLGIDTALQSWQTGLGQAMVGEDGPFAILQGPNWLVTGPDELIGAVRQELGGNLFQCDRPNGSCRRAAAR
jgi:hypothetical protein